MKDILVAPTLALGAVGAWTPPGEILDWIVHLTEAVAAIAEDREVETM